MWPVTYRRTVRFSDTDAQGIVFNANYFVYFDDVLTDLFAVAGLSMEAMHSAGYDVVNAHVAGNFRRAARLGDRLAAGIRLARIGTTSLTFEVHIWDESDEIVICDGTVVQVTVDPVSLQPTPVPDHFVRAMQAVHEQPIEGSSVEPS